MSGGDEDPFVRSQADLMAGVAGVFFVLMAIFLAISMARKQKAENALSAELDASAENAKQNGHVREKLDELRDELTRPLDDAGTSALRAELQKLNCVLDVRDGADSQKPELFVDVHGETVRFVSREASLDDGKAELARKCFKLILSKVCDYQEYVWQIVLEGHTDNDPFNKKNDWFCDRYQDLCRGAKSEKLQLQLGANLELSTRRAAYIFRLVLSDTRDNEKRVQCIDQKLLIAGRGPLSPVNASAWSADQSKDEAANNRRVRLRVIGNVYLPRAASTAAPAAAGR